MSSTADDEAVDLDLVLAEIHAEADRLRRASPYGAALERELDEAFRRHTPPDADAATAQEALTELDALSAVVIPAPDASPRPGRAEWKRTILRVIGKVLRSGPVARLLRMATSEITAFNSVVVRFLRRLETRVSRLEAVVGTPTSALDDEVSRIDVPPVPDALLSHLARAVEGAPGRVLHLGCGRGELVRALAGRGHGAYGVDPRRALHVDGLRDGLDLRGDQPLDHLRLLPDGSLGAVVLDGFVDRVTVDEQIALADGACRALAPGGRVVVVLSERVGPGAVAADLLGGRPLRPDTWVHLLGVRTGSTATVTEVDGTAVVAAVRGT